MYVCITDAAGTVLVHRNVSANPQALTSLIDSYREDLALAVWCVFVWYWIADVCAELGVHFVVPGIGPHSDAEASRNAKRSDQPLALVILYEIGDIARFPRVGNFISYARLVKCAHESAGAELSRKTRKQVRQGQGSFNYRAEARPRGVFDSQTKESL